VAGDATLGPDHYNHPLAQVAHSHRSNLAVVEAIVLLFDADAVKHGYRVEKVEASIP